MILGTARNARNNLLTSVLEYGIIGSTQAGVAERYTRLSQKQVPQGLRVRISPPALPLSPLFTNAYPKLKFQCLY